MQLGGGYRAVHCGGLMKVANLTLLLLRDGPFSSTLECGQIFIIVIDSSTEQEGNNALLVFLPGALNNCSFGSAH